VTVTHPLPGVPQLWHLVFNDATGYAQTIAEFADRVIIVDAPSHQSKLVIQWVKDNHKKPITHLLVTHHHHDHNYGAIDYVAIGATLVVPEDYKYYWTR
jgi:glyoxylase-like metal-dependent hydrolase (beta-lactamase superfamily II)